MKTFLILLAFSLSQTLAQVVAPTTPTQFGKRQIGGGAGNGNAEVNATLKPAETKAKIISYFAVESPRQWKSIDGKSLLGSLIAFEDNVVMVSGTTAGAAAAAVQSADAPKPPEKFTLIRDGKARLLVNQKPFEIPLDRLSEEDRLHVNQIQRAISEQKAAK